MLGTGAVRGIDGFSSAAAITAGAQKRTALTQPSAVAEGRSKRTNPRGTVLRNARNR